MPISSKDEILIKYASSQPNFIKTAWSWKDMLQAFLPDIAVAGAVGGAAAVGGAGAAGTAAAAIGLTGASIATAGGALVIAGLVAGVIFTAKSIFDVLKITDDTLRQLLERFEALDPSEESKAIIDEWIEYLKKNQKVFDISTQSISNQEQAKMLLEKILLMNDVIESLKTMQKTWPSIKFDDMAWDPKEAKAALDKTIASLDPQLESIKNIIKTESEKKIQELSQRSGKNYKSIAQDIDRMKKHFESSNLPVQAETQEEFAVFELVTKILEGTISQEDLKDLEEYGKNMVDLQQELQKAYAEFFPQSQKKSREIEKPISKRAFTIGNKQFGHGGQVAGKKQISHRDGNPDVIALQTNINIFAKSYSHGLDQLTVDGLYGPLTARALILMSQAMPEIAKEIENATNIKMSDFMNYQEIRKNKDILKKINVITKKHIQPQSGTQPAQQTEQQTDKQPRQIQRSVKCPYNKPGMNAEEVNACLMNMNIEDGGEVMSAAEWLNMYGYRTPNDRYAVVMESIGVGNKPLSPFVEWQNRGHIIKNYVTQSKRSEQPGPGQFSFSPGF